MTYEKPVQPLKEVLIGLVLFATIFSIVFFGVRPSLPQLVLSPVLAAVLFGLGMLAYQYSRMSLTRRETLPGWVRIPVLALAVHLTFCVLNYATAKTVTLTGNIRSNEVWATTAKGGWKEWHHRMVLDGDDGAKYVTTSEFRGAYDMKADRKVHFEVQRGCFVQYVTNVTEDK